MRHVEEKVLNERIYALRKSITKRGARWWAIKNQRTTRFVKHLKLSSTFDEQYNGNYSFLTTELLISCSYRRNLRAPRFRLKWKIKICCSLQKESKQILSYEIEKNDLRKELYLLKNKAYNLRNFSAFASILKILHPQCIAIVVCSPPGGVSS